MKGIKAVTLANIIALLLLISVQKVNAQNSFNDIFNDAEYYLAMNDFKEALPLFIQAQSMEPNNYNLSYRIGLCYLNIYGQKHNAIKYLEVSSQNTTTKYREGSYKEKCAPEISLFYLGEAYMLNDELEKACKCYTDFKQKLDKNDDRIEFVDQQIKACNFAKQAMQKPLKTESQSVEIPSITNKSLLYPILSGDRKTLVFSAKEKFYYAIYCCKWDGEKWGSPYNLTLDLALEGEIYATSINHDGTSLLIFHNAISSGNIYISNFVNGKWSIAQMLENGISTKSWETFASFSNDGNSIVFTSNRKGGQGGLDIYIAQKDANGRWQTPRNLGTVINSSLNEESPVLSDDGNTLYFASQGHNTMGSFDVFKSKRVNDTTWSNPYNIGYPINTTDEEIYAFPVDTSTLLISSIDISESQNSMIRQVQYSTIKPVEQIKLNASIEFSGETPQNYHITIHDKSNKTIVDSIITRSTNDFMQTLPPETYTVTIACEGYDTTKTSVYIPNDYAQTSIPISIKPEPKQKVAPETKQTILLENILFEFNSFAITEKSAKELDKIFDLMNANPNIRVEVIGHTDSKGSAIYNHKLSGKRAKSAVNYLTKKGINAQRFTVKGMGAFANIATNTNLDGSDNPEGRKYNRCVMLNIIDPETNIAIEFDEVPSYLQPMDQVTSIIFAHKSLRFSEQEILSAIKVLDKKVFQHRLKNEYILCSAPYKKKSDALMDLNKIMDLGFPEAYIGNERELKKLFRN